MQSLAIKYRPKTFEQVCEQDEIKVILQNQIKDNDIRNAYLFVGSAGCGKTTCARILANEINKGLGNPIELDAASNNSVDDVREIINQAKTKSVNSEYKIFILDECHALSNSAWQAMLKIIEEPPAKTIFIFCTTNPEKIPKTILSRVQRYNFNRISSNGIVNNLHKILMEEFKTNSSIHWNEDSLNYIAKLASGGMRDALTLLDKCIAFNPSLSLTSIAKVSGLATYEEIMYLICSIIDCDDYQIINTIEKLYINGIDLKQVTWQSIEFLLDVSKWKMGCDEEFCFCPKYVYKTFNQINVTTDVLNHILNAFLDIYKEIKYIDNAKVLIESMLILESDTIRRLING